MRTNKPITVFVGDDNRATDVMEIGGLYVYGAPTLRIALAQTIFSLPDAIVIDASEANLQLADETYAHLGTIQHPPLVVLSDEPNRWDTSNMNTVTILPANAAPSEIAAAVGHSIRKQLEPAC